jgi:hypothetical protein
VPGPRASEVEVDIQKLKRYTPPGVHQISAEMIRQKGNTAFEDS